jgi:hypothetical protein
MSRHQASKSMGRRLRPLVLPAVLLAGAAPAAVADTLTVTDCGDSTPGGGGPGQLRRLMNDAGAGDVIMIPACTIALTGGGGEDANDRGDLDVTKNLTLQGTGDGTVITGSGTLSDRLLHVLPGVTATLTNLVISGGNAFTNGVGIDNAGELHLTSVTVQQNTAIDGGGIYNEATGTLFVNDSTLSGNHAALGSGGALYNSGTASIDHSSIVQNTATGGGGGILNKGILFVSFSTVAGNAGGNGVGGGISNYSDTSGTPTPGFATVTASTISGNSVQYGGGGIINSATMIVENTTISGNSTGFTGVSGGGVYNSFAGSASPVLTLRRVTLKDNTMVGGPSAIYKGSGADLRLEGTIVSGGCSGSATITSFGHNLDEGTSCGLAGSGDLTGVGNAKLGPLAQGTGPTATHVPLFDSPAIDVGGTVCVTPTDQRGVARPQGAECDIGAVEWTDVIFQDGFNSGNMSAWSLSSSGGGNLSVTPGAALASTAFGLQAAVSDTTGLYVEDRSPSAENRYRARFYIDPDDYDPGELQGHFRTRVFIMFDDAGTRRLSAVVLKRQLGNYSIMQRCRRDDDSQYDSGFFPISNAPHWVLVEWRQASGPSSADGFCELGVDGATLSTLTDVQNNVSTLGMVRLGTMNVKAGATGTPYFDEFVSTRIGAIPPLP